MIQFSKDVGIYHKQYILLAGDLLSNKVIQFKELKTIEVDLIILPLSSREINLLA